MHAQYDGVGLLGYHCRAFPSRVERPLAESPKLGLYCGFFAFIMGCGTHYATTIGGTAKLAAPSIKLGFVFRKLITG
jgi:hypothetical protein